MEENYAESSVCVYAHVCTQSCSTLCDPMDCSLPSSSVSGDSPGRILEWKKLKSGVILGESANYLLSPNLSPFQECPVALALPSCSWYR